jgi:hypothetical protein
LLLLKGPSSEYWFNPWVKYLKDKGVKFFWEKALTKLEFDGATIIRSNLKELHLVPSFNRKAYLLENLINMFVEHCTTILRR